MESAQTLRSSTRPADDRAKTGQNRGMRITLDGVLALDAIDRHKSFAGAAKELHKAQSAVSYTVKQLEEALGVELFDRKGHRAVLTDAGRAVLDEGRVLLAHARRVESLAARMREAWEPRLLVVVDGILPMDPILLSLKRLADEGVPTHVQIRVEFLGGVQDRFEASGADLMLVKDYVRSGALVEHPLAPVDVVLVAHREHPLAVEETVTLDDLQRHVELTVHDSSDSKRVTDSRIFGGSRVFYMSDFGSKKRALELGLGFGWAPVYLVEDLLARGELVVLPYAGGPRYSFVPVAAHPKDRPLGKAGKRLLELIQARGA